MLPLKSTILRRKRTCLLPALLASCLVGVVILSLMDLNDSQLKEEATFKKIHQTHVGVQKSKPEHHPEPKLNLSAIRVFKNVTQEEGRGLTVEIPLILHQTWEDEKIPGQVVEWIPSWKKLNPGLQYWFWTDKGSRKLVKEDFLPEYLQLYNDYPHNINRADVRRFFLLYKYGGIFADLDVECLKPLSQILSKYRCIFAQEPEEHQALFYDYKHSNYVLTGFMACRPQHPFFKYVLQMLPRYARNAQSNNWNLNILNSTGPMFVAEAVKNYVKFYNNSVENYIHIAPPKWFMPTYDPVHNDNFFMKCTNPEQPLSPAQIRVCDKLIASNFSNVPHPDAFTNHHWVHTWAFLFIPYGKIDIREIAAEGRVF